MSVYDTKCTVLTLKLEFQRILTLNLPLRKIATWASLLKILCYLCNKTSLILILSGNIIYYTHILILSYVWPEDSL
jgi:hypothetical protein